MKEAWCLATSRADLPAAEVIGLYSERFSIEENFRDTKDPRFGLGLSWCASGTAAAATGCCGWRRWPRRC
jgi:hypothetical protein